MQKVLFAAVALAAAAMVGSTAVGIDAGSDSRPTKYVILYSPNGTTAMKAAVVKAGGRVLKANNRVGVATAISANPGFSARAGASKTIQGVARNHAIGRATPEVGRKSRRSNCVRFGKRQRG